MNNYINRQAIMNAIDIVSRITEETNLELSIYLDYLGLKSADNHFEYATKYYSLLNKLNKFYRKQYTYRCIY